MVAVKIFVKGIVQGIGYRWFVQEIAQKEGVNGYVRNNNDGSVEIVAEAENDEKLENFIKRIRTEHKYAIIKDIEILPLPVKNYKNFRILF
ncbi:MAG: acylphosphatase [Endomicrobia bacterium]|nr:acylphosphatase [Endomicrobiia bacterium]